MMFENDTEQVLPGLAGLNSSDGTYAPSGSDTPPEPDGLPSSDEDAAAAEGEPPCPPTDTDRKLRQRIVRRFEAWLDEVLSDEAPPEGLDAELLAELQADQPPGLAAPGEAPEDLGSLWSAMTALVQETKLQGRTFKQLHESLGPLPESVRGVVSAHGEALAAVHDAASQLDNMHQQQVHQAAETARQQTEAKLVNVLLDVRDRLVRGVDSAGRLLPDARANRPGWLGRLLGLTRQAERATGAAEALLDGCSLSLARLDETLAEIGVSEIPCQHRPFDPQRMTAVAVERTAEWPEGTVVEVYRAGYQWHGCMHRPAEVKVVRRPAEIGSAEAQQEGDSHERR